MNYLKKSKIGARLSKLDIHTLEVVKKSSSSLLVKVMGMGIGLVVSIFLGRTLGPDGLGIINLSNQIITLILVFTFLGFSKVLVKEIAKAHYSGDAKHIDSVLYTAYLINGGLTLIVSLALIYLAPWIAEIIFKDTRLTYPLIVCLIAMTPQILSRIFASALVGYKKIWQSNLVDQTLSVIIVGLILLVLYIFEYEITINRVAIAYGIGKVSVFLAMAIYWKRIHKSSGTRMFMGSDMLKTGLPLLIVSAALLISSNADTIMLGWLDTSEQVGFYTIAARVAFLTSFLLQITISTLSPKIAVLYDQGKIKEMERMVQQTTKGLIVIGLISLFIFILGGKLILGLWGSEFKSAYGILVVLAIGQFINIASGPVGHLLIMTNHEKIIRNTTTVTVLLNLALNYFLINHLQALGAAIATTITTALNMGACYYYVLHKIGIKVIRFS